MPKKKSPPRDGAPRLNIAVIRLRLSKAEAEIVRLSEAMKRHEEMYHAESRRVAVNPDD